jgi:hypothetical protein
MKRPEGMDERIWQLLLERGVRRPSGFRRLPPDAPDQQATERARKEAPARPAKAKGKTFGLGGDWTEERLSRDAAKRLLAAGSPAPVEVAAMEPAEAARLFDVWGEEAQRAARRALRLAEARVVTEAMVSYRLKLGWTRRQAYGLDPPPPKAPRRKRRR